MSRYLFTIYNSLIHTVKKITQMDGPVVTVSTGKLRGKTGKNLDNGVFYSFQGIPYAKPPIGPLRFKSPRPAEPWTGIRDATEEGQECFSRHAVFETLIGGEDCLTLNIYTPNVATKNGALKPVMFWIHGGGFTSGSSKSEIYGPEMLLTEDIVLVTINYRTGILGFLSLEDPDLGVPGNAGLKDMVLALKWVQTNIRQFSGDPNNVTIFGESAGGAACHLLILSPLARGLFHKAILQSGCALNIWLPGQKCAVKMAQILGLETTNEKKILNVLQTLPLEQLQVAAEKIPDQFIASRIRPHGFVVEGRSSEAFLCEHPLEIMKSGKYSHVPIMIGYTSREGILSEIKQRPKPFRPITDFELAVPHFLKLQKGSDVSKAAAKEIKQFFYGNKEPSVEDKDTFFLMESDNFFIREILRSVKHHLETSSVPIYLYRISIETELNLLKNIYGITHPGVCHADELGYLFKNLLTPEIEAGSEKEVAIKRFVKLWTNFAKYGDPNPKENCPIIDVKWEPVTRKAMNFLDIDKRLTAQVDPEKERMAFWAKLFAVNPVHKL